jgi:hypothetical protein
MAERKLYWLVPAALNAIEDERNVRLEMFHLGALTVSRESTRALRELAVPLGIWDEEVSHFYLGWRRHSPEEIRRSWEALWFAYQQVYPERFQ